MKKLIGTAVLAALVATSAFAEISLGAWLRVVAAPVAGDGDDIYSGMTNSWGWGARTARLNISGVSEDEKAGFSMGVYNDAAKGLQQGDDYVLWVKPWDWLKVSLGKWDYTTFRGDFCFGSWNWIRPENWLFPDEGLTFDQLGAKSGMQLEITPVDGLVLMWNLPMGAWIKGYDKDWADLYADADADKKVGAKPWDKAYKMLENSEAAIKYTIGDIGTIKAGWGGSSERDGKDYRNYGNINVAFDLTAVENLYVTVGAKIGIADGDYKDLRNDYKFIKVALGASYQILDNLGIAANFGVQTYEADDPSFQFGVGLNVGFTDTLSLNADFRGLIKGDSKGKSDGDSYFSFLVGLQYACSSNGYIGIGFQGSTNGYGFLGGLTHKSDFAWAVPIAVSVWF